MKLYRNINTKGIGKYHLIELQKNNHIEHGLPFTENEFFVLKLKDIHALPALLAYAKSVDNSDSEYKNEILELTNRAGINSKWCKTPD